MNCLSSWCFLGTVVSGIPLTVLVLSRQLGMIGEAQEVLGHRLLMPLTVPCPFIELALAVTAS